MNACRYCVRPLDTADLFCPKPAKCREASSGQRKAVAGALAEHRTDVDRPSLLDRDPIPNDPDQMEMF